MKNKSIWRHKKYPGKDFEGTKPWKLGYGKYFELTYRGPRGGIISDLFFSWQDAKAAGWRKCK